MKYRALPIPCCCSLTSVQEAMSVMWPISDAAVTVLPLIFNVHVSVYDFRQMRPFIKEMNGHLPPQVNLVIDYHLARDEWYLTDGMKEPVGSKL